MRKKRFASARRLYGKLSVVSATCAGGPALTYTGAYAPMRYAVASSDTTDNFPYKRRADAKRFFRTGNLSIPRHYGAHWIVVDIERYPKLQLGLPRVYHDAHYALYDFRQS